MVSEVPKMIVLWNFATKSRLEASLAVWRNLLPYIFQGGLQPGSPSRRAAHVHNCSKFPFSLTHSEFSQHRMSVRKPRKAVKPTALRQSNWSAMQWRSQPKNLGWGKKFDFRPITLLCSEKRLSKHKMIIFSKHLGGTWSVCPPWLRLCSHDALFSLCIKLFWAEFFLISESSEVFLYLKSLHYAEQKTLHQRVLTECFEKYFEKKTWFYLASQKRSFLALFHRFWINLWVS